jgi:periplasmic divalent cation tolerance protein
MAYSLDPMLNTVSIENARNYIKKVFRDKMSSMNYCILYLTCDNESESQKIANALLEEHLIACAKFIPINCLYWWKDKITDGTEILLVMESEQSLFDEIEKIVSSLHSYDTFVLESTPVTKISKKARDWLKTELKITSKI